MGQTPTQPARVRRPEILNSILANTSTVQLTSIVLESSANQTVASLISTIATIVSITAINPGLVIAGAKCRSK